jgi:DNA polymerase-3 subunit epsilon
VLPASLVIVDLETTGANPVQDRVTEIAIVAIRDGELEYEWQALVDPERPIPPMIQRFTGITDEMVRGAPRFAQIADEVASRLGGRLFVAHNARFDVGFLRSEFRRLGRVFRPEALCTVKLSRALYPQHHRHGLDAVIERHSLVCTARHRALGDARVLWDFLRQASEAHPPEAFAAALARASKMPALPPLLESFGIDAVPAVPGAYVVLGEAGAVLDVGSAADLRARIGQLVGTGKGAGKFGGGEIRDIEWYESAGPLGALLKAVELTRHASPAARPGAAHGWSFREAAGPAEPLLELVCLDDVEPRRRSEIHGQFRGRREAVGALRALAQMHGLDAGRLGLQEAAPARSASRRTYKAQPVRESLSAHDQRVAAALAPLRLKPWPFGGPVAVREECTVSERVEMHVFDQWCHLGTALDEAALHDLSAERSAGRFDAAVYKALTRLFSQSSSRVIPLR